MPEHLSDFNPHTEWQTDGPTSNTRIERVLQALRTRQTGHLANAISLIEALRGERERRRTALNVLGIVVALLLEADQAAPPTRAMDPMRRAMLENALEKAVLALYPEAGPQEEPPELPELPPLTEEETHA